MKKISVKVLLAFGLIASLMTGSLQSVDASQNYKITYSPGAKGTFNQELIDNYKATYGDGNVIVSSKTGSITITVEKEATMPTAPSVTDITLKDSRYYVRAGAWEPTQAIVEKSATYVVKYDMLNNGSEYTVRFIDSATGAEIASPIISMANVDDTITFSAKAIDGYEYDQVSKSLKIKADAQDNVIVFNYTGGRDRNVIVNTVFGEDVVNVVPGETPVITPVLTPLTPPEVITPDTEDVENQDTPQSGGEDVNNDTEEVEKEETPKANADSNLMNYVMYGLVGLIIVAGIAFLVVRKKTESES